MKHLFHFNWLLKFPHLGVVLDELDQLLTDPSNEIHFSYCKGELLPCYSNMDGDKDICKLCNFVSGTLKKRYEGRVKFITVQEITELDKSEKEPKNFEYTSINELKKINYKGAWIGYSALSGYISTTRNLEPLMDEAFKKYFGRLLDTQTQFVDGLEVLFKKENYDTITCFNARTADARPVFDLAMAHNIEVKVLELIKDDDENYFKDRYLNSMPHSIQYHTKRINELWDNSPLKSEEKIESASSFFKNRRNAILTRDIRVYAKEQETGYVPESVSADAKNVVIYLSSEDEFVAVNQEFDDIQVFESQEQALHLILSAEVTEPTNYFIRLHPNLKSVDYGYHKRLYELSNQYPNTEVIGAASKVDSYGLLDQADIVITFGSTICAESCYWGKPVILLGGEYFYYLDVAYKPDSIEGVMELVNNVPEPKPQINALKFGFYMMNFKEFTSRSSHSPKAQSFFGGKLSFLKMPFLTWPQTIAFKSKKRKYAALSEGEKHKQYPIPTKER